MRTNMTTKLMTLSLTLSLAACSGQMDESMKSEINSKAGVSDEASSEDMVASTSVSAMSDDDLSNNPTVCIPEMGTINGGSVTINDGASQTVSPIAVLSLGGLEETLRMKISNDVNCECGTWEFYSPTKQWALEPVDGVATVGVQYKDYEGRVSRCVTATINMPVPTTTTTLPPETTTTTLPPETTTTTLPPETTTTTLPPVVTTTTLAPTTTTLPPVVTTTTLPPVITTTTQPPIVTTTTLPPIVVTTTLPPVVVTTTTLPPVVVTTTTLPPVVSTTTLPPVVTTTTLSGHYVNQNYDIASGNKKVDILIIDDNSGSMSYEQKSMAKRMSTFLQQLKGLDWRVAITTTDPKNVLRGDGRLLEMKGLAGQYHITSAMDHNMAQKILGDTIQRTETGNSSEQGIHVAYRALERSLGIGFKTACGKTLFGSKKKYEECIKKEKNPNKDFFRNDASLAIIVISDENESGNGMRNRPENLLKFVNTTFPNKLFNYHSIVTRTNDKVCLKGHGQSYGTKYEIMSKLTGYGTEGGSIIGSVCAADYGSQLSGISESCQKMQKVIQLQCAPVGNSNNSVQVQLNGSNYNGAYSVQGDRLVFTNYLPAGSYNLQYRCQ